MAIKLHSDHVTCVVEVILKMCYYALVAMETDYPFFRMVRSPLTDEQLRPLDPRCRVVQFEPPLTNDDHLKLAAFLRRHPKVPLRVFGFYSEPLPDLSFLRHYPFLTGFQIDVYSLQSTDGIENLPSTLQFFGFGQTKAKFSLTFLTRFNHLQELFLDGHTKDLASIGTLARLERLTLRSITLPDLGLLMPLKELWSLDLKLGGTKDLRLLPEIGRLKYLELWMIKGLSDLGMLGEILSLQNLYLQALKNVTELPSFRRLKALRRVTLDTMKGITNLTPVAEAPSLRELLVIGAKQLNPPDFMPFKDHPTLKAATIGLGSVRKDHEVQRILGLPSCGHAKREFEYS